MNNDRIKGWKWIPITVLFIGLILRWIHVDEQGNLLNIGFICFGLVTLIDGIKKKYYKPWTAEMLKILLPIVIMLLAVGNLAAGKSNYAIMGIAILLYYGIVQGQRFVSKRQI